MDNWIIWVSVYVYGLGVLGVYSGMLNDPRNEGRKGIVFMLALFFPLSLTMALVHTFTKRVRK